MRHWVQLHLPEVDESAGLGLVNTLSGAKKPIVPCRTIYVHVIYERDRVCVVVVSFSTRLVDRENRIAVRGPIFSEPHDAQLEVSLTLKKGSPSYEKV